MNDVVSGAVKGKYVVITGATSGIGLAAALELAARGANLGIIARNEAKAAEVATQIRQETGGCATIDVFAADMASQSSIRKAAAAIAAAHPQIDLLLNNAGALFEERILTEDGVEMTWAVNHLAPFLLTNLLLDQLKASGHGRVITTASHGHKMAKRGICFDDLGAERAYRFPGKLLGGPTLRYAETKLANILFTAELARRLAGTQVSAYCFDPGLVATNFNQNNGRLARMTMAVMKRFARTPEKGAETLVWLAEATLEPHWNGGYFVDRKPALPSVQAQDTDAAKRLWEESAAQIRV
ncbi:SDR family NAD(P)-dependent oxidoreductase [Brevibacillus fluminis]|uniref:SDR family NAD(P)-dependent oxidoreductase n=1 Tax=Brevibacillus fluminis TaxID=511487 RepID=A0A3M8DPE2_9BACL|nr:SDR family NAD(P)-dependent oxidoreductase [Brevibacillus fluminis]RNB90000.1 SDR family NAD(P)-dependent oxidoreductase [Brevibacillus fluminis]